jgi:hypothetical protein
MYLVYFDDDIGLVLDLGYGPILDDYLAGTLEDDRFHRFFTHFSNDVMRSKYLQEQESSAIKKNYQVEPEALL